MTLKPLRLKDSQYFRSEQNKESVHTALYCRAVDKLKRELKEGKVDFLSFSSHHTSPRLEEEIVWYEIDDVELKYKGNNAVITRATFYTSHYIGTYSTTVQNTKVHIVIEPRFGNDGVFNYLLSYAYGIYLPKAKSSSETIRSNTLWLLAVLYKAALNKALETSHIPKEYRQIERNLDTFRGQLHLQKHLYVNLFDQSKFYCRYRKLTMDTTINRTLRYVYRLLKRNDMHALLADMHEYDAMLQSFGVAEKEITPHEIADIRYTKLNIHYKKPMEIASLIIKRTYNTSALHPGENDSFSYFLDMAQLWEDYLLKVLRKHLSEYDIYSPNERGGTPLFDDGSRKIRPDIIIEKDSRVVAVLDAKYKYYAQVGRYADIDQSVSREDLYQMSTYLYHYASQGHDVVGLFVSPVEDRGEIKTLSSNPRHKIGVVNLDISRFDNTSFSSEEMLKTERRFVQKIREILP